MFKRMVVLGPTRFYDETKQAFAALADKVRYDPTIPTDEADLIRRIGDADALLVALQVQVGAGAIAACPALRYIGMCNSLYGADSANVDILAAQARGITVTGIRDYGDEGVVEYVISELVRLLHGFGEHMWRPEPTELTGLRCGILGMGTLGHMIARALGAFGAEAAYFSRTRKPDIEAEGVPYMPLGSLLGRSDIVIACLNKNAILLHDEQFAALGNGKILVNIAIGPCTDDAALARWLAHSSNYLLCDTPAPLGDASLACLPNVLITRRGAGASVQSTRRYNEKILRNVQAYAEVQGA